jgi:hypothetical protein
MPFEDFIYEMENENYRNENGRTIDESFANGAIGDSNQQYKSGSNKTQTGTNATTVVCHVLLAALLVVSASVALFEVCRDRLSDKQVITIMMRHIIGVMSVYKRQQIKFYFVNG